MDNNKKENPEIEEKEEIQTAFFRDGYLWKLEERVNGFCARQGIEIISMQYTRRWFEHICMVVFKQRWLVKKHPSTPYPKEQGSFG